MNENYTPYHIHTEQSLIDSCTNYKLYVDKAVELNQNAIAFTEHGNIQLWVEKKMYCDKMGIKYIHGVEIYLTETLNEENKIRDNYHTVLLAKNYKGLQEINELCYISTCKDHRYYKPRISFDEFLNISDDVIKISACISSPLKRYNGKLKDRLLQHYDYYEIQYHNNNEQIEYNKYLYNMSQKYNKPLIAGTDTHSINNYKAECKKILQISKGAEFSIDDNFDLTYKTYNELTEMFRIQDSLSKDIYLQAIENTNMMADSVEPLELDKSIKYPIIYGEKDEEIMWQTLRRKYKEKVDNNIIDASKSKEYGEKIKEEMRVFKKVNMIGFMLFMSELMTWCREQKIAIGFGRGSVSGSEVAYISDITDVDPVVWHTIFSRFCNESRLEVGDIDIDVYDDQRKLIYDYIIKRFGKQKTGMVFSNGTLVEKGTIDAIGRALCKIYSRKSNVEADAYNNPWNLTNIKKIKKEYRENPDEAKKRYPELFYYFDGLINTVVSQSKHAAGIVASPINLIKNYGMFVSADGDNILPINMEEVHEVGLVKYDILGLKNIGIIRKTCEYINVKYPLSHEVDWNDQNVYEDMKTSPVGIFQFEGDYAFELLKTFNAKSIDDMSLANATIRPSGKSYRNKLMAHIPNKNPSDIIDNMLKPTLGYLVYQEQTIQFLQDICGLSGSEADNVRRAIGRKQLDRLQKALPQILDGYCSVSDKPIETAKQEAKEFLRIIEDSSSYQFGYNHSTGYSMIGYLCAYLRYYYPKEFVCAFLNCAKSNEDIYNGTMLAKQKNIKIYPPRFRKSLSNFTIDTSANAIYKGLSSIKDIGESVGDDLYALKDNIYPTFIELLNDIKSTSINVEKLNILIKINFFKEFGDINNLLYQVKIYNKFCASRILTKAKLTPYELQCTKGCYDKETKCRYNKIDNKKFINKLINNIDIPKSTPQERIKYDLKLLGYTDIIIPNEPDNMAAVTNVNINQWGTPWVTLYQLNSGITITFKTNKNHFNKYPCEVGNVLKCSFIEKEQQRFIGVNEKGKNIYEGTGEIKDILKIYAICN